MCSGLPTTVQFHSSALVGDCDEQHSLNVKRAVAKAFRGNSAKLLVCKESALQCPMAKMLLQKRCTSHCRPESQQQTYFETPLFLRQWLTNQTTYSLTYSATDSYFLPTSFHGQVLYAERENGPHFNIQGHHQGQIQCCSREFGISSRENVSTRTRMISSKTLHPWAGQAILTFDPEFDLRGQIETQRAWYHISSRNYVSTRTKVVSGNSLRSHDCVQPTQS